MILLKWQYSNFWSLLIVDIYHFWLSFIHLFKKMKHWNLDITGYWVIGTGCQIVKDLELSSSLSSCSKDSWKLLLWLLSVKWPIWWLNELWFKRCEWPKAKTGPHYYERLLKKYWDEYSICPVTYFTLSKLYSMGKCAKNRIKKYGYFQR